MSPRRHNTQLFALAGPPPERLSVAGGDYALVRVFKHDFYAATCLYENRDGHQFRGQALAAPATGATLVTVPIFPAKLVVKFYRDQPFWGLPMTWAGRMQRDHEKGIYRALAGVAGVPRYVADVGATGCAIEYVDAVGLDRLEEPPPGWFDDMRRLLLAVHARGVAYVDANKRSNMLVGPDGRAWLVDYQISVRRRDDWPWPMRAIAAAWVRYMQGKDLYHLVKHKRRMAPELLTEEEVALSRKRSFWHEMHRMLGKPYRAARRRFLRDQHAAGRLVSPTAKLEDQEQPEKATWRDRQE